MKLLAEQQSKKELFKYDLKKVDRLNFIMICIIAAIVIAQSIDKRNDITVLLFALPMIALTFLIYRIKFNRFVKSLLFGIIPMLAVSLATIQYSFQIDRHYLLCATTALIALYLNKKLLLVFCGIIDAVCIALYAIAAENFLGQDTGFAYFISVFIILNGQMLVLYFLTKWGGKIIDTVTKNNEEVSTLLQKIQQAGETDKKWMEYQKNEGEKLLSNLKRLSEGELVCDLEVDLPDESIRDAYELFQQISDNLFISVNTIKGYILEISCVLAGISKGNLREDIRSQYKGDFVELKESINHIVSSLNGVLGNINAAAEQVKSGAKQVSDVNQAASQSAVQQAGSIEQLTATISDIADRTKHSATHAAQANELTAAAKKEAATGNEKMKYCIRRYQGYYQNDRGNIVSDKHTGAECCGRGRAGGCARKRLCRGGRRGSESGQQKRRSGKSDGCSDRAIYRKNTGGDIFGG